jgi:phage tail protein X
MLVEKITVTGDDITLSLIVWRRFHKPMPGLVEMTLDMNQDLADAGYKLPLGTTFYLPIPEPKPQTVLDPIRLW